jgi:hypothetical protein
MKELLYLLIIFIFTACHQKSNLKVITKDDGESIMYKNMLNYYKVHMADIDTIVAINGLGEIKPLTPKSLKLQQVSIYAYAMTMWKSNNMVKDYSREFMNKQIELCTHLYDSSQNAYESEKDSTSILGYYGSSPNFVFAKKDKTLQQLTGTKTFYFDENYFIVNDSTLFDKPFVYRYPNEFSYESYSGGIK